MRNDKSDNLIFVKKTMTATEVARNFSEVLDAVEAGDEITITRGNKPVAVLGEAKAVPNSVAFKAAMREHYKKYGFITKEEADQRIAEIRAERDANLAMEADFWNE